MMLEDAGIAYSRQNRSALQKITNGSFGVPAIMEHATKMILGQTTAHCEWLGSKLGYAPREHRRFVASKLAGDIADIWSEGYGLRKALMQGKVTKEACMEWLCAAPDGSRNAGRFPRLLSAIETTRREAMAREQAKSDKWVYLVGDQPCYVDFLALNAMRTMNFCFPKSVSPSEQSMLMLPASLMQLLSLPLGPRFHPG